MVAEKLWYKNAIIYQLHVKCYCDSNGDGIGDFKGLTRKLDYIQALGCNAIWLQPFYPSPLKDDGYDIADYSNINPDYGTLKDFRNFLTEAHARGLKVITELVINHTSDQHAWFQRARRSKPGSKYRNYYVWSDTPDKYSEARIIFKDFETSNWAWDPVANAYYWHRFYTSQPDLNYDSLDVHEEIFKIVDFWMQMGVDGMRLDAIPYLYQREGTDCENLPETHQFLKKLRAYIDSKYENRMLLAEANQWPEQAANYFGNEDECQMAYHFPVMPRLFMAIKMEDRFPIIDIMEQTPLAAETCQWAMFLRNHDELTLEMVTDEERDYMYQVYAKDPEARINLGIRRRLSPLLGNDRMKIELMNVLLFSLPGSPIIYYGDEIGMGDNFYLGDRNGVRTPMQWDISTNAGFSECNPQKLYLPMIIDPEYHHAYLNVKNQEQNDSSLLRWMRSIVTVRQQFQSFGCGTIHFINSSNNQVLVFIREYKDEKVLVIANLSRTSQYIEIHLKDFIGLEPVDLFSLNKFATIRDEPYGLTLGRYGYYWLSLNKSKEKETVPEDFSLPKFHFSKHWTEVFNAFYKKTFVHKILPEFLMQSRWYRSKSKSLEFIEISQIIKSGDSNLVFIKVSTKGGFLDEYCLPISFVSVDEGLHLSTSFPRAIICRIRVKDQEGFLIDSFYCNSFQSDLIHMFYSRKKLNNHDSIIKFTAYPELRKIIQSHKNMNSEILRGEQSNTSIVYDELMICKIFRKISEGVNPDFELTRYLYEEANFHHVPKILGVIEKTDLEKTSTFATIQAFIPNNGDAWNYTLNALDIFFQNSLSQIGKFDTLLSRKSKKYFFNLQEIPNVLVQQIGFMFLELIALLGERSAEMHLALGKNHHATKDMMPEPFTIFYQKSLFQGMRGQQKKIFSLLRSKLQSLDESSQILARSVLEGESNIIDLYKMLLDKKFNMNKIRIHGDYHLGQVLVTGKDVVLIDFEGEPLVPLSERKLKKSCLQDVAGMIRSFHYAAISALNKHKQITNENHDALESMAFLWYEIVSNHFLKSYLKTVNHTHRLVPHDNEDVKILIDIYLMNKAIYELNYELNARPEWVDVPLKGILMLIKEKELSNA